MRILHAIRSDGFAGVERHVAALAVTQAGLGHDVAVIGGDPASMAAATVGGQVRLRPASTVLEVTRQLDRPRECDVLHVHMTAAETAALLAVRSWRVPAVTTRHFGGRRGVSRSGRLVAPLIERRLRTQLAISRYVAEHIESASTVVYPGVASRDAIPGLERERTILLAQRLEPEKSSDVALTGFARSGLASEGWRLTVAGDGSQRAPLEALARSLGVEGSVDFLGHQRDMGAHYRSAGILVAPCAVEGLGLSVLEAMATATPIVASAAAGHLETAGMVPDAALFEPGDVTSCAAALSRLASNADRREAYGAELRGVQRTLFTLETQARSTEAVYQEIV